MRVFTRESHIYNSQDIPVEFLKEPRSLFTLKAFVDDLAILRPEILCKRRCPAAMDTVKIAGCSLTSGRQLHDTHVARFDLRLYEQLLSPLGKPEGADFLLDQERLRNLTP
jgi:hypothetical protein